MLPSSEFRGDVLHSSGGPRWAGLRSCGAKFSSPTPFACCVCSFESTLLESNFLCHHLILHISKEGSQIPFFWCNSLLQKGVRLVRFEHWVIAIESSCRCQRYELLINFTRFKCLRVPDVFLQITETGDFVGSIHPFAFSVSFVFITLWGLQIHYYFAASYFFLEGTDLSVLCHILELSVWFYEK